jgi:hypothetical protein
MTSLERDGDLLAFLLTPDGTWDVRDVEWSKLNLAEGKQHQHCAAQDIDIVI